MNTNRFFNLMAVIMTAIAMLFAVVVFPAYAGGKKFWIHHESQGVGDQSWDKCMPESAWNGHSGHTGDSQGDRCDETTPTPEPTESPTPEPTDAPPTEAPPTEAPPTTTPPTTAPPTSTPVPPTMAPPTTTPEPTETPSPEPPSIIPEPSATPDPIEPPTVTITPTMTLTPTATITPTVTLTPTLPACPITTTVLYSTTFVTERVTDTKVVYVPQPADKVETISDTAPLPIASCDNNCRCIIIAAAIVALAMLFAAMIVALAIGKVSSDAQDKRTFEAWMYGHEAGMKERAKRDELGV